MTEYEVMALRFEGTGRVLSIVSTFFTFVSRTVRRNPVRRCNDARVLQGCADFDAPGLDISTDGRAKRRRHAHAGGHPDESPQAPSLRWFVWIPAYAGMTQWGTMTRRKSQR